MLIWLGCANLTVTRFARDRLRIDLNSPKSVSRLKFEPWQYQKQNASFIVIFKKKKKSISSRPRLQHCVMCFSCSFAVHVDANSRLARLKQLLHDIPPHNLAVVKRIMFHLNRYGALCSMC